MWVVTLVGISMLMLMVLILTRLRGWWVGKWAGDKVGCVNWWVGHPRHPEWMFVLELNIGPRAPGMLRFQYQKQFWFDFVFNPLLPWLSSKPKFLPVQLKSKYFAFQRPVFGSNMLAPGLYNYITSLAADRPATFLVLEHSEIKNDFIWTSVFEKGLLN